MILFLSLAAAFVFFLCITAGVVVAARKRRSMADRIQFYSGYAPQVETAAPRVPLKERMRTYFREHQRRAQRREKPSKLDIKMQRADLPVTGREFVELTLLAAVLVWVVVMIGTGNPMRGYVLGVITGMVIWVWMNQRVKRRQTLFMNQLTDCLTLLANALRAGFSFMQAMELISREMKPPISTEFERVMRETNVGKPVDQALSEMDDRIGNPDFSLVITAVLVQQQVGGNLAEVLDIIHHTINERIRLRREIRTLTSQGRASGLIVAAIPFAMALFFLVVSPDYLDPLFNTPIGQLLLAGMILLELIGFFIIKKIVDIKV